MNRILLTTSVATHCQRRTAEQLIFASHRGATTATPRHAKSRRTFNVPRHYYSAHLVCARRPFRPLLPPRTPDELELPRHRLARDTAVWRTAGVGRRVAVPRRGAAVGAPWSVGHYVWRVGHERG
jgi:hypothetical protein